METIFSFHSPHLSLTQLYFKEKSENIAVHLLNKSISSYIALYNIFSENLRTLAKGKNIAKRFFSVVPFLVQLSKHVL